MTHRQQQKLEKEASEYGSQDKNRLQVNFENLLILVFLFNYRFLSLQVNIQPIISIIENCPLNFIHIIILQFLNIVR
jgi:hypothetical protein